MKFVVQEEIHVHRPVNHFQLLRLTNHFQGVGISRMSVGCPTKKRPTGSLLYAEITQRDADAPCRVRVLGSI